LGIHPRHVAAASYNGLMVIPLYSSGMEKNIYCIKWCKDLADLTPCEFDDI
jgi:hypothetical protein